MDTKALRQKILDLAIRGKLVPQDPNDEPAEVLLERIREQKQQMLKEGKLKKKDLKNDTIIFKGEDNLHYEKFQDGSKKCIDFETDYEIPDNWLWCNLGLLFNHNTGKALNSSNSTGKALTYITTSNVYWNRFELNNLKSMPFADSELEKCTVKKGDLLVCEGGDIGRAAIWNFDDEIRIQNHLHRLRVYDNVETIFYYYVLYLYKLKGKINGKGIGLQGLSSSALHSIIVPVPPIAEQKKIVMSIEKMISIIDIIESDNDILTSCINNAKSKILDLAIRGKLVPQDPNDEPASVLLERIQAEKEELIKQGKIKRDKKESVIFKGDDNSYYEKVGNKVNCIDEEIPFELPEYWAFIRLKTTWELISGRDLSPSEYNDKNDGIPYITGASNFRNGYISLVRWTTVPQVITRRGDLLLTCKGTIGEIAHNNFGEAHIARQIMAIHNNYSLNVDFLALCIEYSMPKIKQAAKGLIPGISREDILSLVIPIPPIKEQENICNKLKVTFSAIEHIEKSLN
ncbi:MAG TPA: restriction endonuclease subunit S [Eubacterium sp.]|nr:restriction endonuclease subunit S [Eubacterium sp.]